jgi:hypothetical protein
LKRSGTGTGLWLLCLAIAGSLGALAVPAAASPRATGAQVGSSNGGAGYSVVPQIRRVTCVVRCARGKRARAGSVLRVVGSGMAGVTKITFQGGSGRRDDVNVKVTPASDRSVRVRVPRRARSGPLVAVAGGAAASSAATRPVTILPPPPPPPATGEL